MKTLKSILAALLLTGMPMQNANAVSITITVTHEGSWTIPFIAEFWHYSLKKIEFDFTAGPVTDSSIASINFTKGPNADAALAQLGITDVNLFDNTMFLDVADSGWTTDIGTGSSFVATATNPLTFSPFVLSAVVDLSSASLFASTPLDLTDPNMVIVTATTMLGEIVPVSLLNSTVVPVPAAAWLFGSGILGLIGVARRKA